jgi:formylmethanofuran dehydrogenase subunit E
MNKFNSVIIDDSEFPIIFECYDCGEMFPHTRKWKLEPRIALCEDCHEKRELELCEETNEAF